ncbi:reverse transcriptase domain-containing protein, partial [Tanacetum coccineum]
MNIPNNNLGPPPMGPPHPNNNGPPPVVRPNGKAPRLMEELCQSSIDGRGGPIASIPIQATDYGLRHHMIQQVQNTCQFHGLPGDDANRHIDKFLEITQHMKQNEVSDDALRLSPFLYSLTHHAIAWYDRLPRNSIHSFDYMMRKFLSKYFPPSMVTKLRNEIMKFEQKSHESLFEAWERYKLSIDWYHNHIMLLVTQIDLFYNGLTLSHWDTINAAAGGTFMQKTLEEYDVKAITTRSGVAYDGPMIPPTPSPPPKEVERETEVTKDNVQPTSLGSTAHVQPSVVQDPIPEPEVAPKPKPKPSIPYPSRLNDQKLREKANNQMLKFLQIFQRLHFDISFTDALLHMSKFASTFKSFLRVAEDVFVKVGTFYFLADFVVVDYDVDPRVPLIIGRPFLRTVRALIDVYGEELTLRVNDEAITFKVGQTSRDSHSYEMINHVNVIDVACEEYAQEVLGFLESSSSGNATPSDPIIASSYPSFTPFEAGDFILEEIQTFLRTPEELSNLDDDYY